NLAEGRPPEIGATVETLPAPGIELRGLAVARRQRIDLLVTPCEAQREPFLSLAAEFRQAMRLRPVIGWKFIGEPVGLAEILGAPDAGLFPELAHGGIAQVLALVDAALRHLPVQSRQDDL